MTTKQRAYLKSLAMKIEPIFQIGKSSMSPGLTEAVSEALEARELIKISVLNNCGMIRENWLRSSQEEHVLKLYR